VRIAIPALGTRGDVLPYVVLGDGLRRAGHDVIVSTTERFRGLVENAGLRFHALPGDPGHIFAAAHLNVSPRRPLRHVNAIHKGVNALVEQVRAEELLHAWGEVELVVFGPSTTFGHFNAEKLGARSAMVTMTPSVGTGAFAHPVLSPLLRLGRWGNRATWLLGERAQRQTFKEPLRPAQRRAWGLPTLPLAQPGARVRWPPFPVLHAYSTAVVPRPSHWPGHVTVTGWLLPPRSRDPLPSEVERFLDAGDPPVYVGFGSMPVADPERIGHELVGALARTGSRAIVCGKELVCVAALDRSDSVLVADELPHERLFERVSGVVHHGGSGTLGAGLRAGRPTLVVPFLFDQFFWGRRVRSLGAGPSPIPFARLSRTQLASALRQLRSERCRAAARSLGQRIAAEDGVARAAQELERVHT
jgi:sterol 3beta-glucosyltransferase